MFKYGHIFECAKLIWCQCLSIVILPVERMYGKLILIKAKQIMTFFVFLQNWMTLKKALYVYEYGLNMNCILTSQSLLTTTKFLVVADGEAPPIQDEVECSTCKRSFAPKVLVKSATSHSVTAHINCETMWLTFVVWSLKVLQLQAQFDLTSFLCKKRKKWDTFIVLNRPLDLLRSQQKYFFRRFASADMVSAVWMCHWFQHKPLGGPCEELFQGNLWKTSQPLKS